MGSTQFVLCLYTPTCGTVAEKGTFADAGVVRTALAWRVYNAEDRVSAVDQGNVHSKLPVALDKLFGSVEGIDAPRVLIIFPNGIGNL